MSAHISPETFVVVDDSVVDSETFRSYRTTIRYSSENMTPVSAANVPGRINRMLLVDPSLASLAFPRIPRIGDAHPQDSFSFCVYRELRPIPNTGRGAWDIICEYRTRWPVYDGDLTPLHEPAEIEYILDREEIEVTQAYKFTAGSLNKDPSFVNNTAFDKFIDAPVTESKTAPIITITKNYWDLGQGIPTPALSRFAAFPQISSADLRKFENTVCIFGEALDGKIAGFPVKNRQALMESIYPVNSYFIYEDKESRTRFLVPYLRVTYKIKIAVPKKVKLNNPLAGEPLIYHEVIRRNTGTMELIDGDYDKKSPIFKNGEFVTQPVDLALNGEALDEADSPILIPFLPYEVSDWSPLGLPKTINVEEESPYYSGRIREITNA